MQICDMVKTITHNSGHANHNALLKLIYDYFLWNHTSNLVPWSWCVWQRLSDCTVPYCIWHKFLTYCTWVLTQCRSVAWLPAVPSQLWSFQTDNSAKRLPRSSSVLLIQNSAVLLCITKPLSTFHIAREPWLDIQGISAFADLRIWYSVSWLMLVTYQELFVFFFLLLK